MLPPEPMAPSETLHAYLAEDRLQALARGGALPDRTSGAVLVADIVSFTPLTEALAGQLGPRTGAETLADRINSVYTALTTAVARWRGSIIGFAGDAITCWFDAIDGYPSVRAAACALELQTAMAPFTALPLPAGGVTGLALKVAIATGAARRFAVGDPNIQRIDVLAGSLLERVSAGEHLCQPGTVLLDAVTAAALGADVVLGQPRIAADGAQFTPLRALAAPPAATPWERVTLPLTLLRPWVLPAIRARHEAGLGTFLTELRPVVALFLHFSGIDFDADEQAGEALDQLVRHVQAVLGDTGGVLLQLTLGDKGAYLYAAFGAPIAYEDDTRRAVRAALALQALARPLALPPFRIGLSQGIVRTGAYGGPVRRTYGALGDAVNVAARLMQLAAPGETVATDRIQSRAGPSVRWEPLPPLSLKGKAAPIRAVRLVGLQPAGTLPRSTATTRTLAGRSQEVTCLEQALATLMSAGTAAPLVIEGEAGIGKSQLALALLARAQGLGVATLVGTSEAVEQRTPFFAWRAVVAQLFGLSGIPDDPTAARAQVLAQLQAAREPVELAPLLGAVLPLQFTETAASEQLAGAVRAEQLHAMLIRLLQRAARQQATLILVEDVHWLDPTSWELVRRAMEAVPALFVLTTRPPGLQPSPDDQQLRTLPALNWLRLGPLTTEELFVLLCERLGVAQLAPEVAEIILARAEGNPYFSVELAATLLENRLIEVHDGSCRVAPHVRLSEVALPDSLQGLIGYRLDQLPPEQQLTVKVASVVGRVFAARAVHAVHPLVVAMEQLRAHLDAAEQADLTVLDAPEPALTYAFRHSIAQEVAYSLLPGALQRTLHGAVARWLEQSWASNLPTYYPLLAYHWQRAQANTQARAYFDLAGEQALRGGAYREAVELLEQAQALEPHPYGQVSATEPEEPAQVLLRLARRERLVAEALFGLGQMQASLQRAMQSLVRLGAPLEDHSQSLLASSVRQLAAQLWARLTMPYGRGPLAQARDRECLEASLICWRVAYYDSHGPIVAHANIQGLLLALQGRALGHQAIFFAGAGYFAGYVGVLPVAHSLLRHAASLAHRHRNTAQTALAALLTGIYHSGRGQWAASAHQLQLARENFAAQHDWRSWLDALFGQAFNWYYQGELARSKAAFVLAWHVARVRSGGQATAGAIGGQGLIALRQGQLDAAAALLAETAATAGTTLIEINAFGGLALAHWRLGRSDTALAAAEAATARICRTTPISFISVEGYGSLAEVYIGLWQQRPGEQHWRGRARWACRALQQLGAAFPIAQPQAWWCRGMYYWLMGRHQQARRAWQLSLERATRLQMPYEVGRAHAALATLLPDHDEQRRVHLEQAAGSFRQVGAAFDLQVLAPWAAAEPD